MRWWWGGINEIKQPFVQGGEGQFFGEGTGDKGCVCDLAVALEA